MMKWWGWGAVEKKFDDSNRPNFKPWLHQMAGVEELHLNSPISEEKIILPEPILNHNFINQILLKINQSQIFQDSAQRILHAYGKSYADLLRIRKGIIKSAPDMVLFPKNHDEVVWIMKAAYEHDVVVVPFGGGTNIVGCVEVTDSTPRMKVSLDMQLMNEVLNIDSYSQTAVIQAGILGTKLDEDLKKMGFTLGHHPDSFEFSTLGGWIATRSAGMQSNQYGRIEDMVLALKVVTPIGEVITKNVPASAAGPNLNALLIGSEGTLGVITEATMKIHPAPEIEQYYAYLFKNFEQGASVIYECHLKGFVPSVIRLQDCHETALVLSLREKTKGFESFIGKIMRVFIKFLGYQQPCIMIVGFEGQKAHKVFIKEKVKKIIKNYKGFNLGKAVGQKWSKEKYNMPYIRDFVMDYSCMVDVAETAVNWKNLINLYQSTIQLMKEQFKKDQGAGYIGCHLSHSYHTGACLYFTYGARQKKDQEIEQYYEYKKIITEGFLKLDGALTHHHALGYDHLPWLKNEIGENGMKIFQGIKKTVDPHNQMNPGKFPNSYKHEYFYVK